MDKSNEEIKQYLSLPQGQDVIKDFVVTLAKDLGYVLMLGDGDLPHKWVRLREDPKS